MSIDFRCTQCDRLLRTGDDAAGKQAKCPGCGLLLTVPGARSQTAAGTAPPASGDATSWPGATPFGSQPPGAMPFGSQLPGAMPFGPPWTGAAPGGPQAPSGPVNPYQSPGDFLGPPAWHAAAPLAPIVPTRVALGDLFSRTWSVFKDQYGICLGLFAATLGLAFLAYIVAYIVLMVVLAVGMTTLRHQAVGMFVAMFLWLPVFFLLPAGLFILWIHLGLLRGMISVARGQPTSLGALFSGGAYLFRAILASLLLGLIGVAIQLVGGFVAGLAGSLAFQGGAGRVNVATIGVFVLTSIALAVVSFMFCQFQYLIVDRNAGVVESLSLSRQITSGNKLTLFGGFVLIALLAFVTGLPTCGIGVLFGVGPYAALLMAMFYLAMSGQTTADQLRYDAWQNPPPTPVPDA